MEKELQAVSFKICKIDGTWIVCVCENKKRIDVSYVKTRRK